MAIDKDRVHDEARGFIERKDYDALGELYFSLGCNCLRAEFEETHYGHLVHWANNLRHTNFGMFDKLYRHAESDELVEEIERIHNASWAHD